MSLNLAINLCEAGRLFPDKLAIKDRSGDGERRCSYSELSEKAMRFAAGLHAVGVKPGERVAIMIPNCQEFPVVYYGTLAAGCTAVPFNMLLKTDEVAYHLSDSEARALVAHPAFLEHARGGRARNPGCKHLFLVGAEGEGDEHSLDDFLAAHSSLDYPWPTGADDDAVFIYTSGTTGKPKGAVLSHSNLFINAMLIANMGEFRSTDVFPAVLPMFHSFGQTTVMNAGIHAGVTFVSFPRFEAPRLLESMERDGITMLFAVPTMYQMLLDEAERQGKEPAVRQALSGGASIAPELIDRIERRFHTVLLEGYGLSETSPGVTFNRRDRAKPRSVGLPIWGVGVEIHDEQDQPLPPNTPGEVCIRGHNILKRYHNQPEQTAETLRNGWFHSGDVGYLDEEGYLFIVDRIKELIIRGGYNVYPREVEEVIYQMEGVREASVIGIPDKLQGEEIAACVSLQPGAAVTEEKVIAYCRSKLAGYKYPRKVLFLEDLPKGSTGKILKKELKNRWPGYA